MPNRQVKTAGAPSARHQPVPHATRGYTGGRSHVRPYHTNDHRYGRPSPAHLRPHPAAHRAPPRYHSYRPYYSRWWVHPYYRWCHVSVSVVSFHFVTYPWVVGWSPPMRAGFAWTPGHWAFGVWWPGYWAPVAGPPVVYGVNYVLVPGYWVNDVYVEGYYRPESRNDGDWEWVDGYYLEDSTFVRGYWQPASDWPDGYVWEPGFFDGDDWLEGFWRPEYRSGYRWIDGYFDDDGVFLSGYWEPTESQEGAVWVPGWFDGNEWVAGYWVDEELYANADVDGWEPEAGWDEGWEDEGDVRTAADWSEDEGDVYQADGDGVGGGQHASTPADIDDERVPLAIPVGTFGDDE